MSGPGGRGIPADYEITKAEPGKLLEFAVTAGPARPHGRYTLQSAEVSNQTKLTFHLWWQPHGLQWLIAPMVAKQMPHEIAALDKLKDVLETK